MRVEGMVAGSGAGTPLPSGMLKAQCPLNTGEGAGLNWELSCELTFPRSFIVSPRVPFSSPVFKLLMSHSRPSAPNASSSFLTTRFSQPSSLSRSTKHAIMHVLRAYYVPVQIQALGIQRQTGQDASFPSGSLCREQGPSERQQIQKPRSK